MLGAITCSIRIRVPCFQTSSSDCFADCDALPLFHVECPIHSFGAEKKGDARTKECLGQSDDCARDDREVTMQRDFACNDEDDEFAYNSFDSCAFDKNKDRYDCCFYDDTKEI